MVSYIILMVMDVCLIQCDFICYFVKKVILLFLDFLKKSNYSEPSLTNMNTYAKVRSGIK